MNSLSVKILAGLLLLAAVFTGGFYYGKGEKEVEIKEKVVFKEGETKTVVQDRIVTVTKIVKPDGTIEETTKTEDKSTTKDTKTTKTTKEKDTEIKPVLSKYSLGVVAMRRWDETLLKRPDLGVTGGMRVLGEVWVKATVVPEQSTVLVGLELQF